MLVLVVLYVGLVAYSAVQVVKSAPRVGPVSSAIESNGTVGVSTSFMISDPSLFAIQQFALHFRILNGSGTLLVASTAGPTDIAADSVEVLPVHLFLPLTVAGASLLTEDQYLEWEVWGNASYGYLFSVSLGVQTQKSWGAPFANVSVTVGAPTLVNGSEVVAVTLSFANDASFTDAGSLDFQVVSTGGPACAQGSFLLNVPPNTPYDQTENLALASGCNPSGGHVDAQYVGSGFILSLPSEPVP